MTADAPEGFLTALRLSDSFLPVGTYTASYGIEQYVNEDELEDADALESLVGAYLERVVGPSETVAVANAHAAAEASDLEALLAVDERLHAATLPREFRESSTKAGGQLCDLFLESEGERRDPEPAPVVSRAAADGNGVADAYADAIRRDETPGHHAVVFGVLAQRAGLDRERACQAQAYSFVVGLLGAAQRLGRFGHTDVQEILGRLLPDVEAICARHLDDPLERLGAFAPYAETMGMRHERAGRRLFMS